MNYCDDSHLESDYEDRTYIPDDCEECMESPWDDEEMDDATDCEDE